MPQSRIFSPPGGGGGGGPGTLTIQENGVTVVGAASVLNFVSGATVASGGPGIADITVTGGGGGGAPSIVLFKTLTAGEISAKNFTLPVAPSDVSLVLVDQKDGTPALEIGSDYSITGTLFDWNGLGLEAFLAEGDILRIVIPLSAVSSSDIIFVADETARLAFVPSVDGTPVIQLDTHALWVYDLPNSVWAQTGMSTLNNTQMREVEGYVRTRSPAPGTNAAGSEVLNWATTSYKEKTGGTATLTFANMVEGQTVNLVMVGPGAPYVLTFAGETFRWSGAVAPTPTPTAGRRDVYTFTKINNAVYGAVVLDMG